MRILYAVLCMVLWAKFVSCGVDAGCVISSDMEFLTISIIAAGALAGGD